MVENEDQFDGLLMTCLQKGGGITNFFELSAIERKTQISTEYNFRESNGNK